MANDSGYNIEEALAEITALLSPPSFDSETSLVQSLNQPDSLAEQLNGPRGTSLASSNSPGIALGSRASATTVKKILELRNSGTTLAKEITILSSAEVLDFRFDDFWLTRAGVMKSTSDSPVLHSRWAAQLHGIEPPDEFDWFSLDRMGKILSMSEACELFSIMRASECTFVLKELMLNARRAEYWACPKEKMPTFADTLVQMSKLSKLILRGLADDHLLGLIGKTCSGLKYLDVSCSKYVTDKGIQKLFFQTVKDNSALYIISSWVLKNMDSMWPVVRTLEYLDFSWTNVTSLARKMVVLLPGSYMFKRHFAVTENEAYGHFIFIRKTPDFITTIQAKDKEKFQANLHSFAGRKGVQSFTKLVENHPWKNCQLTIYQYPTPDANKVDELDDSVSIGIISPSPDEKRIHGLATFWIGNLTEIYSIFPFNINHIGLACPKLRILSGTITGVWRNHGSLFPSLTEADLFGEPDSVLSLINSTPNLKKLRIRIVKKVLTDDALINALSLSMSNRYLEELWIAPGSYKKSSILSEDQNAEHMTSSVLDDSERDFMKSGTELFHTVSTEDGGSANDPRIEDLLQLSAVSLRRLITCCKKISRIGNLSWWKITEEELEDMSTQLDKTNSGINLLWDNIIIPGGQSK